MKEEVCNDIITRHIYWSMGAGLIPIPMIDIAAVTAIQLDMLRQLCKVYEVDFNESQGKAWVAALTTSSVSRLAANFVKFIPGIGSIVGGITMSVMSGASTYAVGNVALKYLEEDMDLFEVDLDEAKSAYEEAYEEGKDVAEDLKKKQKGKEIKEQVIDEIERLAVLKEKGLISEEEYKAKKETLLSEID